MMTNRTLITITQFVVVFLCFQPASYAGVYKWVDDTGQIHYTDQPKQPGADKFTVRTNTTTKPAPSNTAIKNTTAEGEAAANETESEPKAETETSKYPVMVEIEPGNAEKRGLCNEAKSDVASISSRGRMREINEKGEYIYLSEQQRQQRLSAAKSKQRKFCR